MSKPILNLDDLEFMDWGHGEKYKARIGSISRPLGAGKLGYNLTILPPGKCAFPFHSHRVNEEMFFILEGAGEVRLGDQRHPLKKGDVLACPAGDRKTAHQILNTSTDREMKYLAVSTSESPEIAEYPDSDKVGVLAEFPPNAAGETQHFRFMCRTQATMDDYWEGE